MSQINPLLSSIIPVAQSQKEQVAERTRDLANSRESSEIISPYQDEFIHAVDNAEELAAVREKHEHPSQNRKQKRATQKSEDNPDSQDHIDLTA